VKPGKGKVVSVGDAVGLVADGATIVIGGSGAGHALPQRFIDELAAVYREEGRPKDLTTVRVVGIGDFADRGFSQLGLPGLMRRTIGSNIGNEPRLGALVEQDELESYSFPQGVLSQLMREIAAGRPGLVTQVGLGTYVDPRQTGGKQNARTTDDLVEVITLRGREWLLFHAFPIDVAVIRGTTADEDGNVDREGVEQQPLATAQGDDLDQVLGRPGVLFAAGLARVDVRAEADLRDHPRASRGDLAHELGEHALREGIRLDLVGLDQRPEARLVADVAADGPALEPGQAELREPAVGEVPDAHDADRGQVTGPALGREDRGELVDEALRQRVARPRSADHDRAAVADQADRLADVDHLAHGM
jgi:acyl CoA:acetate/3-ketoacid CoA transferase alpha subunit